MYFFNDSGSTPPSNGSTSTTAGAPRPTTQGAPGTTTKAALGTTTQGAPGTTTQGAPGTTTKGAPGTTTTGKTCSEMEYINTLVATDSVRATPKDIPNKGDLISKGVDFTDKNPTLVIEVPKGGAIVRDIKVPSSNVDEIEVVFTTQYGDEKVVVRGAPTSLPKEQFPQGKVTEIVVKVTKTSDGKAPADVTLSVIACAEGITTGATTQGKTFYNMAVVSRCSNHTVFCSPIRFHIRRSRHNYQGCSRNDDTRSSRHNHKGLLQERRHKELQERRRKALQAQPQRVLQAQRPLAKLAAKWSTSILWLLQTLFVQHRRTFPTRVI